METVDLVVPVREAAHNQQLRYALRSWAAHLPHGRVWIVGHRPSWLAEAEHLPTRQTGTKYQNTTMAVRAACEHPEVSETFLLANDDMFVMKPVTEVPVMHRGPVREVESYYARRGSGLYLEGLRQTRDRLAELGHPDPMSYELHVPLPVEKAGMLAALDAGRDLPVIHKRTMYSTLAGLGGTRIDDVKVMSRGGRFPRDGVFLSTLPETFANGQVGAHIRRAFPRGCRYEQQGR